MASCIIQISSSLAILLWMSCVICGSTQDPNLDCIPTILVPRHTVWKSAEKKTLKINCTVVTKLNCWKNLTVSWCKIDESNNCRHLNHSIYTTTDWRNISGNKIMYFLIFRNLSMLDAGLYRCKSDTPFYITSHTVNVTVTAANADNFIITNDSKTTTNTSVSKSSDLTLLWPYVYICSGIAGLVLTVVALALLIMRCRGAKESKKAELTPTQRVYIPPPVRDASGFSIGNTNSLPAHLSPSTTCIYDNSPVRASSQRTRPSGGRHPANPVAPKRSHEPVREVREEEENLLVYASLNHKPTAQRPVRVSHPEETSEYAAIRVS